MGRSSGSAGATRYVVASYRWNAVNLALSSAFFVADRAYTVRGIRGRVDALGVDIGTVTAVVRKVPSGTAIASGTVLHTGSFNLKGTDDSNQTLALSSTPSDLAIVAGDALAVHLTGVPTSGQGCVSVTLEPS